MKKLIISAIAILMLLGLTGCGQVASKSFGGSYTLELPKGEKLVNVTWKDSDLWYLTEPMPEGYQPKEYKFQEDSTFGVMEGTVTIVESK